jgi:hypothetical protein
VKAIAASSEPVAEEAANQVLKQSGTAGDALIAGFLAAAGARPGVLLSPIQILLAGPGVGVRAFDGRCRQPGSGIRRPRGFVRGQEVPDAAYAAVPASLGALALLHAHHGELTFERLAEGGVESARSLGARDREAFISRIGQLGPSALAEGATVRRLLAVVGRAHGGLLTESDLADVRPETSRPREAEVSAARHLLFTPWSSPEAPHRLVEVIASIDVRGVLGVLAYSPDDEGVPVPELGVSLSRDAVVVRRGIPRVLPGEPIPCPAPILIVCDDQVPFLALGVKAARPLSFGGLSSAWSDVAASGSALLGSAREAAEGESAFGVLRSLTSEQAQRLAVSVPR